MTSPLGGKLALARSAVSRAAEHRTDEEWLEAAWKEPGTAVLLVDGGRTLVNDDAIIFVGAADVPADADRYFLGADADRSYFAVPGPLPDTFPGADEPADPFARVAAASPGIRIAGLREVGGLLSDRDAGLLVLAVALANWHETHTHCPRCGAATTITAGGFVRVCPVDGSEHYPRTDPAIIVLVTDSTGERCLLGRGAAWPPGRFSTLAGFVEPGESAEAATAREVEEETGVRVDDVVYLGSQPWPFPSSLMLGFTARAGDPDAQPVPDGSEVIEARWYSRAQLAASLADGSLRMPQSISIARRLIEDWYGAELDPG